MKTVFSAVRLLAVLTFLLGGLYPAFVWAVGRGCFASAADGSLVTDAKGKIVGSALLAQKTEDARYIYPRPSAGDYATVASGASSLSWTSAKLRDRVAASIAAGQPAALATTSGSGLDPHLPPEAVLAQLDRVGVARAWDAAARGRAEAWIAENTEGGSIGPAYVNVLRLNLALDDLDAARAR